MLSEKLINRLRSIERSTDRRVGMYRGEYWEAAKRQHSRLEALGLIQQEMPHNPSHKPRVVITELGRSVLRGA